MNDTTPPTTALTQTDKAFGALRAAIVRCDFAPGARLRVDELSRRYDVSSSPVREALARLATEGLVELRHNRGATVAYPSLEEARDVFAVRRAMERLVVEELCGRLTRAQAQTLEAHVAAEDRAQGRNGPESIRLAGEFHLLLAAMTGNALLERYVNEVASRCSLILAIYGRPHSSECAVNEHRELIAALASGDAARATHLMDHHLEAVMGRALIKARAEPDIRDVLAAYAETEGLEPGPARTPPKARSRART